MPQPLLSLYLDPGILLFRIFSSLEHEKIKSIAEAKGPVPESWDKSTDPLDII